jgi:hypothetical protein
MTIRARQSRYQPLAIITLQGSFDVVAPNVQFQILQPP